VCKRMLAASCMHGFTPNDLVPAGPCSLTSQTRLRARVAIDWRHALSQIPHLLTTKPIHSKPHAAAHNINSTLCPFTTTTLKHRAVQMKFFAAALACLAGVSTVTAHTTTVCYSASASSPGKLQLWFGETPHTLHTHTHTHTSTHTHTHTHTTGGPPTAYIQNPQLHFVLTIHAHASPFRRSVVPFDFRDSDGDNPSDVARHNLHGLHAHGYVSTVQCNGEQHGRVRCRLSAERFADVRCG
jgi:hypothetical protein